MEILRQYLDQQAIRQASIQFNGLLNCVMRIEFEFIFICQVDADFVALLVILVYWPWGMCVPIRNVRNLQQMCARRPSHVVILVVELWMRRNVCRAWKWCVTNAKMSYRKVQKNQDWRKIQMICVWFALSKLYHAHQLFNSNVDMYFTIIAVAQCLRSVGSVPASVSDSHYVQYVRRTLHTTHWPIFWIP